MERIGRRTDSVPARPRHVQVQASTRFGGAQNCPIVFARAEVAQAGRDTRARHILRARTPLPTPVQRVSTASDGLVREQGEAGTDRPGID